MVAGGANFPDKRPWEGGAKVWHDSVFVLETPASQTRPGSTRQKGDQPKDSATHFTLGPGGTVTYSKRPNFDEMGEMKKENHFLQRLALSVLKKLRPRRGETVHLILDGSHVAKRAKKMAGLGYYKNPATDRFEWGHQFLALGFWFRDLFLPAALAMYWAKKNVPAGRQFRTMNPLAAEMIRNLPVPSGVRIRGVVRCLFSQRDGSGGGARARVDVGVCSRCEPERAGRFGASNEDRYLPAHVLAQRLSPGDR